MIYIKDEKGRMLTLKEISQKYNVPLSLVQGRYNCGNKDLAELIKPKWERKGDNE